MVYLFIYFEELPYCVFKWLYKFALPATVYKDFLFSKSLSILAIFYLFNKGHSNRYEVVFYCDFDFPGE
jgi:hypothetical protein